MENSQLFPIFPILRAQKKFIRNQTSGSCQPAWKNPQEGPALYIVNTNQQHTTYGDAQKNRLSQMLALESSG